MKIKHLFTLMALMLCMSVFCVPAFASDGDHLTANPDRLSVSTSWKDGDLLRVEVRDNQTDTVSTVELRMSDYADNAETITIQAVDADGNKSGVIIITNPYYKRSETAETDNSGDAPTESTTPPPSESAVPDGDSPFTPDGTGSVVDDIVEQNGKEFFSITTEAGNEFFLIVDRKRDSENVYLLNAVTENDLMALAKKGDGTTQSAIPDPSPPVQTEPSPSPEPPPETEPEPKDSGGVSTGSILFIALAVAAAGGAGYYFKIVKPKQQAPEVEDDYEDEPDMPDDSDDDYYKEEEDNE